MSFTFLDPTQVDRNMFYRCVNTLSDKDGMELHMLNDAVLTQYDKNLTDFLSYLISVGEYLEEYEKCSQLIIQQKKYKKWLTVNLETVKSISNLLNNLKLKHDDEENN
jgi:predicted nucleic-acid-binding protein